MAWTSELENAQPAPVGKTDGYAEAWSGAGTNKDRSTATLVSRARLYDEQTLTDMYLGDGFARRIVDSVAEEMTRAGISFEMLDEETQEVLQDKFESLKLMKRLNEALQWSRCFGGSVIVMGINDGGAFDVPLNPDGVKNVEFLRVYDRFQATIIQRVQDPFSQDYNKPEFYLITPHTGVQPYKVHHSRLIVLDGENIPERMRQQNEGWGASSMQHCAEQLVRLGMSHKWANMLLERMQQAVQKIPNLMNTLATKGGEALIKKRVEVVDMVRGTMNTIVIDGAEDYAIHTSTMTGVNELLDRFAQAVSSVSGIPMFVLMGQGKGGLNNTGAAELEAWYAKVKAMQEDILLEPIVRIVTLCLTAMNKKDVKYKVCFNPLYVPSDKEQAETESARASAKKQRADAAAVYVGMGALDPAEVRKDLAADEEYKNIDLTIDVVEPPEEPEPKAENE